MNEERQRQRQGVLPGGDLRGWAALTPSLLLAGLLLWAPLPFGGVTPWGRLTVSLGAFACLAAVVVLPVAHADLRRVRGPLVALVVLVAFALLQSLPLPLGLVALISPEHAELTRHTAELMAGESARSASLSVAPEMTRRTALFLAAVGAAFVAGSVVGAHRGSRRLLALALLCAAFFQVLYGARRWFSRATTIWDVEVSGIPTRLRGTFVNSNHLAYYLAMALAVAFAWLWWAVNRARQTPSWEHRLVLAGPPALAWLTLFTVTAFTGSRGGLAAALFGTVLQGALLAGTQRRFRAGLFSAVLALAGMAVVASIGFQEGLGRLLGTSLYEVTWSARREVYGATIELWQRFPVTGTGIATFREAFPLVQPAQVTSTWWHAHSDWLELLVTGGVVASLIVFAGLLTLVLRLDRVLRQGRRSEDRAAALAAFGALIMAALHSLVDFGITMPGTAVTLAVVVGAGAGCKLRIEN